MSSAALTQFLIDVTRGHAVDAYARDPDAVLKSSALTDELRNSIRKQDIEALWLAGAHPMALLYFARACGWAGEKYYECITTAGNNPERSRTA